MSQEKLDEKLINESAFKSGITENQKSTIINEGINK